MKVYMQILIVLAFSFLGEGLSDLLKLPVPGSILGMLFLFLALQYKLIEFRHVDEVGSFLINNMTILFLPAGVGIMAKWGLISHFWWQISLIVVVALIVNVLVLGKLTAWIKNHFEGDYIADAQRPNQLALDVINQHSRNKHIHYRHESEVE